MTLGSERLPNPLEALLKIACERFEMPPEVQAMEKLLDFKIRAFTKLQCPGMRQMLNKQLEPVDDTLSKVYASEYRGTANIMVEVEIVLSPDSSPKGEILLNSVRQMAYMSPPIRMADLTEGALHHFQAYALNRAVADMEIMSVGWGTRMKMRYLKDYVYT